MKSTVTLISGDGIGPEVIDAMRMCVDATGANISWDLQLAGARALKETGASLPKETINSITRNKVVIKGPLETPLDEDVRSTNMKLRKQLDLFASVRPTKNLEGLPTLFPNTDIIVIRENTEDLYAGIEFESGSDEAKELIEHIERLSKTTLRSDTAIGIKPLSVYGIERILHFAFEYAVRHGRQKITLVHKAHIMKYTDGLFLKLANKFAKQYEGRITCDSITVDHLCMKLVDHPDRFDVLVMPNLYGDIVSDLCAGLVGGLGVVASANYGEDIALFEPIHGTASQFTGLNKANPTACIFAGVMMLRHLDEVQAADRLEWALREIIKAGQNVTADLKDDHEQHLAVTTEEMAEAVCHKLQEPGI